MQAYQKDYRKPKISRFVDFEGQTDEWTKRLNVTTLSRVSLTPVTSQTERRTFLESVNLKINCNLLEPAVFVSEGFSCC